jgi:DNA-binding transcriptional LysR family regulator
MQKKRKMDFSILRRYILLIMDTRFLDSLVSVIECGSIAAASRQLNLTPAGVAQRIRALEDEIGTPLVVRAGRTVRPTATAVAILSRARTVQQAIRDLKSVAASGLLSGELRLGVAPTLLSGLAPDILSRFTRTHPQIEVRISRNNSSELYTQLTDGRIDLALSSHPSFLLPKTCQWRLLREEPFVVVAPSTVRTQSPFAILSSEPFIRLDRKVYAGQMIDAYLRRSGLRPRERFEMDGPEAIAVMVDRGLGVSILPDWAPPWPAGLNLRKIRLPDRNFVRKIGLLWMRGSLRIGLINAFLKEAVKAIR